MSDKMDTAWWKLREGAEKENEHFKAWFHKRRGQILGVLYGIYDVALPVLNQTYAVERRRYIVARIDGAHMLLISVSGSMEKAIAAPDDSSRIKRVRRAPTWSGKEGRARYNDYVKTMTDGGNAASIVPFNHTDQVNPPEDDPDVPESDEDPDVTIEHTAKAGTVAEFDRNSEIASILRHGGFLWVPSIGSWRRQRSVGLPKTTANLASLAYRLREQGYKVAFKIENAQTPEELRAAKEAKLDWMDSRADTAAHRSAAAVERGAAAARQGDHNFEGALSRIEVEGYYPTPPELVARVIQSAEIKGGDAILEPSAGTGALAQAANRAGGNVDAVEISPQLAAYLRSIGIAVVAPDILAFSPGMLYDVIVMNPPFEDGKDAAHVQHAFSLLKPGGRLVAIMSEGPFFRMYRRDQAFREWLAAREHTTERIPETRFGRAVVPTRLVVIDKRDDEGGAPDDAAQIQEVARQRAATWDGNEAQIRAALMGRSRMGRRALDRMFTTARVSVEQTRYAEALSQREKTIRRDAARLAAKRESFGYEPRIGDRVGIEAKGGLAIPGIITRVWAEKLAVASLLDGETVNVPKSKVHPMQSWIDDGILEDSFLTADLPESTKSKPKTYEEQLRAEVRQRRKEIGATSVKLDPRFGIGFEIGFENYERKVVFRPNSYSGEPPWLACRGDGWKAREVNLPWPTQDPVADADVVIRLIRENMKDAA